MIYLLDTNAISDLMRGNPCVVARLAAVQASDRVITCIIARGEVLHGLLRMPPGKRKDEFQMKAANIFASILCEPANNRVADFYAMIKVAQEKLGMSLAENDLWIAAIASEMNATLVSRDKDLKRVAGLSVVDWTI